MCLSLYSSPQGLRISLRRGREGVKGNGGTAAGIAAGHRFPPPTRAPGFPRRRQVRNEERAAGAPGAEPPGEARGAGGAEHPGAKAARGWRRRGRRRRTCRSGGTGLQAASPAAGLRAHAGLGASEAGVPRSSVGPATEPSPAGAAAGLRRGGALTSSSAPGVRRAESERTAG